MRLGDIELKWLGHSGFLILNSKIIYIDPYNITDGLPKADLILITHSHYDHCSFEDMRKVVQEGTRIVMPADCQSKVTRFDVAVRMEIVAPGDELDFGSVKIFSVPAYNLDKHFHPKDDEWMGYLVKMNDLLIYHAGDTDTILEMQKLTGHKQEGKKFIALLPIGGRFTMSADEAIEAVKILKPNIAIPMHYGSIVGDEKDAQEFKELCEEEGFECKILEKEK